MKHFFSPFLLTCYLRAKEFSTQSIPKQENRVALKLGNPYICIVVEIRSFFAKIFEGRELYIYDVKFELRKLICYYTQRKSQWTDWRLCFQEIVILLSISLPFKEALDILRRDNLSRDALPHLNINFIRNKLNLLKEGLSGNVDVHMISET